MRVSQFFQWLILFGFVFCLSACQTTERVRYAPVIEGKIEHIPAAGIYRVKPGDTLYSIAWRYGFDYQRLAERNHLVSPYEIRVGQVIYLRAQPKQMTPRKKNIVHSAVVSPLSHPVSLSKEPTATPRVWRWPATGKVVGRFAEFNKGINISGVRHAPIYATAAGKVVYCGNGLRAYGNLIIIKHNAIYLSAYANNSRVLVKQGDFVQAGQKIAEMGAAQDHYLLHFEIRRKGLPVNPLTYLR